MIKIHKILAVIWLLGFIVAGIYIGQQLSTNQPRISSDISLLLPNVAQNPGQLLYEDNLKKLANDQLLVMLRVDNAEVEANPLTHLQPILESIEKSQLLILPQQTSLVQHWLQLYRQQPAQLLNSQLIESIKTEPSLWQSRMLNQLYQPFSGGLVSFMDDPLSITQQHLLNLMPAAHIRIQQGVLIATHKQSQYYLLPLTLLGETFDLKYQQAVGKWIQQQQQHYGDAVSFSGLIYHAAYASKLAKREISTIGLVSLLGIALLFSVIYRSFVKASLLFLPIVVGIVVSIAACLLVFQRVHSIVLVFGAGLIGVAVDYSLHYYFAQQAISVNETTKGLSRLTNVRRIFAGLVIGLLSTVLAYAAQVIPPFPGLRQMSVFAIVGLVAAWLSVVLWFPYILANNSARLINQSFAEAYLRWPHLQSGKHLLIIVISSVVAVGLLAQTMRVDDKLANLNTSTAAMVQNEQRIQNVYGQFAMGQYFIVTANSTEQLLQRSEQLAAQLQAAVQKGQLIDALCLSDIVPSAKSQRHSYQFMQQHIYAPDRLIDQTFKGDDYSALRQSLRSAFAAMPYHTITINDYQQTDLDATLKQLYIGQQGEQHYSLCQIALPPQPNLTTLASLADFQEGIFWVNQPAAIAGLLQQYRQSLLLWISLAYAFVFVILYLRYGRSAWRVVFVPAIASVLCLLILSVLAVPITLFHLLALLLILGIGLDANIFMTESNANIYTWVAVSCSLLTSLLAFGLLAFSQTPILHFIGQTVFIGLVLVWLLTPSFVLKDKIKDHYA